MKILVLSLLRTGDLFQHWLLIKEIARSNPQAEIHLVTNDLNKKAAELLGEISKVHVLERSFLQKYLVEDNRPWGQACVELKTLIHAINRQAYDRVYNMTHTRFSARFMDCIQAKEKVGIQFQDEVRVPITNKWMEYFNQQYALLARGHFHYLTALSKSLQITTPHLRSAGFAQARTRICLQVTTSDSKKNWSVEKFRTLANTLARRFPEYQVTVLGAPTEKDFLQTAFADVEGLHLLFPTWQELPEILQQTRLLVSGDTSVLHLAVHYAVPILALFLGSADARKTGPYQAGALILQSAVQCFPCRHSSTCPMSEHLCETDIQAAGVAQLAEQMILGGKIDASNDLQILRVQARTPEQYELLQLQPEDSMQKYRHAFEQHIWQIYLDGAFREVAAPFGSFARALIEKQDFALPEQKQDFKIWLTKRTEENDRDLQFINQLEKSLLKAAAKLGYDHERFQKVVQECAAHLQSLQTQQENFRTDYFLALQLSLGEKAPIFPLLRKIKLALTEVRDLLSIENKFIQILHNESKEGGQLHGKRSRILSEARAPEA